MLEGLIISFIALMGTIFTAALLIHKKNKEIESIEKVHKSDISKLKSTYNELDTRHNELDIKHNELLSKYNSTLKQLEYTDIQYYELKELIVRNNKEEIQNTVFSDYLSILDEAENGVVYPPDMMADYYTAYLFLAYRELEKEGQISRSLKVKDLRDEAKDKISSLIAKNHFYENLFINILCKYPGLSYGFLSEYNDLKKNKIYQNFDTEIHRFFDFKEDVNDFLGKIEKTLAIIGEEIKDNSNKNVIKYMSKISAYLSTIDIRRLRFSLSWGNNNERRDKIRSLTQIKKDVEGKLEKMKWAEYQLNYLINLYPVLEDVIDTEFNELDITFDDIENYDPVRDWITKEEYQKLSTTERNQLALDNYVKSRKSNWQIGRDYELSIGHRYETMGLRVEYTGTFLGIADLGRDLIVHTDGGIKIMQCKYWSKSKLIHEKHIMQLFGTVMSYRIEHGRDDVIGVLITNTKLSDVAKFHAKKLGIRYEEDQIMDDFPRIKCNIGRDEKGKITKIYHLPMDQQYDRTKITKKGEFYAHTVADAEAKGFRRAYKWYGDN